MEALRWRFGRGLVECCCFWIGRRAGGIFVLEVKGKLVIEWTE